MVFRTSHDLVVQSLRHADRLGCLALNLDLEMRIRSILPRSRNAQHGLD